jgi:hypothetical protein
MEVTGAPWEVDKSLLELLPAMEVTGATWEMDKSLLELLPAMEATGAAWEVDKDLLELLQAMEVTAATEEVVKDLASLAFKCYLVMVLTNRTANKEHLARILFRRAWNVQKPFASPPDNPFQGLHQPHRAPLPLRVRVKALFLL